MPMSPKEASLLSPRYALSDSQCAVFDEIATHIDQHLCEEWVGGGFVMQTSFAHPIVIAHIVRAYEEAGWQVSPQPLDGAIGKAAEILCGGGNPQWLLQLTPRWAS